MIVTTGCELEVGDLIKIGNSEKIFKVIAADNNRHELEPYTKPKKLFRAPANKPYYRMNEKY